ncbi:hypothetical protein FPV67DRAFT_1464920 [Lyophyllum atratum]|nr:hypothetical protein FPV67DRAFT_1464920 [Lyophyllum atratum]
MLQFVDPLSLIIATLASRHCFPVPPRDQLSFSANDCARSQLMAPHTVSFRTVVFTVSASPTLVMNMSLLLCVPSHHAWSGTSSHASSAVSSHSRRCRFSSATPSSIFWTVVVNIQGYHHHRL